MIKGLLKTERTSGFFRAVNTSRINFGRIRSSIYGEPFSEYQQPCSAFPGQAGDVSTLAPIPQFDRKVFFFHVMKTGGVTFRRILASIYGSEFKVCYDPTAESVEASLLDTRAIEFHSFQFKGQVAHMHSGLTAHDRWDILEGHNCFTMLREPVDQAISLYYYLMRRRMYIEPVYKARGIRFPENFEEYIDGVYHFNLQTAFLANKHQLDDASAVNKDDLARAKALLTRLRMHVGLTERFADSMNIFETVTGRQIPGDVIHNENRNPDRLPVEAIPLRLRDKIHAQSAPDLELYEFGRQMFLDDFSQCKPTRRYTFQDAALGDAATVGATTVGLKASKPTPVGSNATESSNQVARKTVFFHIMKTGGMTFRRILSSIYGDSFYVIENPEIEAIGKSLKTFDCVEFHTLPDNGDFIHMHAHLAMKRRWDVMKGADIFTMFRDPVDQVVSQYFYMQQERAHIEPAYRVNGIPFPETIDQYLDNPAHLNNQLAFLVGKYRLKPGNDVTREDLDAAKEMLVKLNIHPGLTERFAESLHIFETITGRRVPGGRIFNQNQNPDRLPLEAISAKTKDRIRSLSAFDNELYAFARDIFMKDVALCGKTRQYTFIDTAKSSRVLAMQ